MSSGEKQLAAMANAIRFLSADAIEKSKSGHPGMPLGMADVAAVLFSKFIKLNPEAPRWFDRDRFVLSAGHGSMLMYSLLYLMGYEDITIDDIMNFRQLGAKTAGHPEYGHLAGIDMTTGPLGQGISSAVGMALAERMINAKFGDDLCSHYTYVINGDGCLMEGISEEAVSLAGHLGLNKLIVLWDNNNITIDGTVDKANSTDQIKRFQAVGWNTIEIDGHDYGEIEKAIAKAQKSDKPTLIACKTKIGFGAPTKCGTSKCHGSPLGEEEIAAMRKALNWNYDPFEVPEDILAAWRSAARRNADVYAKWQEKAHAAGKEFDDFINDRLPADWDKHLKALEEKAIAEQTKVATRKASQLCLEQIVPYVPQIVGGSADLGASNLTFVDGMKSVAKNDYKGNNVMYGIREHAMGAIMNGLALHGGAIPYGGTFFVFSDYMRPAMRLAALMGIRVIYVLTHDSIGVGEDGPTHQPVETISGLRVIPNLDVIRPADPEETAGAWMAAMQRADGPTALILTRQKVATLNGIPVETRREGVLKGAYIARKEQGALKAIILASGSELELALKAAEKIGEGIRVVSMPSFCRFDAQPAEYRESVLPSSCMRRVSVEAGVTDLWWKYLGCQGEAVGINRFGFSAPGTQVLEELGMNVDNVVAAVHKVLAK